MAQKETASTVTGIMAITLLGKAMGLWRDRLLAVYYGAGMEANAFYTASRIPRVFFDALFASAIAMCLIPVFGRLLTKEGEDKAYAFAGNFISVMGAITAILTGLGMGFAPQMVELFAVGYDEATKDLAVTLTQMMFPTVFFTGIAFSFVGILQGRERFFIPALLSTVSNGIIILYFYVGNQAYGIYGLAVAYLIGWAAQAGMQIPSLRKLGFRYRPNFSPVTPEMKQVFALMAPVMISTWVQPINLTIHTRFASTLYGGSGVSMLEIASNLYLIIAGVFILSITNVIFPRLTALTAEGKGDSFQETLRETLHVSLFFTLPMSVGLMVVAEPLVTLFYGGGAFGAEDIALTSGALGWISLGMAGYGIQNIISRGFFAKEDGKTPLLAGLCSIGVNIILCMLLVDTLAVNGLAIASTVSATVYGVILLLALHKKEGNLLTFAFGRDVVNMILATGLMALVAQRAMDLVQDKGVVLSLVVAGGTGSVTYFLCAWQLHLPELSFLRKKKDTNKII